MPEKARQSVQWLDSFSVGHAELDDEHRIIVRYLNAIVAPDPAEAGRMAQNCRRLYEYLSTHFRHEERVLDRAAFPRLVEHTRSHSDVLCRARELRATCGELCRDRATTECTREWVSLIVEHLVRSDLDFKSHMDQMS